MDDLVALVKFSFVKSSKSTTNRPIHLKSTTQRTHYFAASRDLDLGKPLRALTIWASTARTSARTPTTRALVLEHLRSGINYSGINCPKVNYSGIDCSDVNYSGIDCSDVNYSGID